MDINNEKDPQENDISDENEELKNTIEDEITIDTEIDDTSSTINVPMLNASLIEKISKLSELSQRQISLVSKLYDSPVIKGLQETFEKINTPALNALSSFNEHLSAVNHITAPLTSVSKLATMIPKFDYSYTERMFSPLQKIMDSYAATYSDFSRAGILGSAVFESLNSSLSKISKLLLEKRYTFDIERFEKAYLQCLLDSMWFPYASEDISFGFMGDIIDIRNHTRAVKSRTSKIDKCVFSYFNKTRIRAIKSSWNKLESNRVRSRIMRQCIDAHIDGRYALTISTLVPLWESIIKDKVNHKGRICSEKLKDALWELVDDNGCPEIINEYYGNYIMRQFDGKEDIKENTPMRHPLSHGVYNEYPTKKTSLNAILFTDFLLRLDSLSNSDE